MLSSVQAMPKAGILRWNVFAVGQTVYILAGNSTQYPSAAWVVVANAHNVLDRILQVRIMQVTQCLVAPSREQVKLNVPSAAIADPVALPIPKPFVHLHTACRNLSGTSAAPADTRCLLSKLSHAKPPPHLVNEMAWYCVAKTSMENMVGGHWVTSMILQNKGPVSQSTVECKKHGCSLSYI